MAKRMQTIKVKDYGDDWVNRLAVVCGEFEKMELAEQIATLRFVLCKYGNAAQEVERTNAR